MTQREIICITCPLGCHMNVRIIDGEAKAVEGNQCKKGVEHARQEVAFPNRILTTTMETADPHSPLLPVKTSKPVPRDRLDECMREIAGQQVRNPVKTGEAVIEDILGLGIDIIACRNTP